MTFLKLKNKWRKLGLDKNWVYFAPLVIILTLYIFF